MAEKSRENGLNLTIVALVALVAIVSLAAIVLNGGRMQAAKSTLSSTEGASNVAGEATVTIPGAALNSKDCNVLICDDDGCAWGTCNYAGCHKQKICADKY